MTTKSIESLIVGARLGLSVPLPKDMKVGFSFGAQYMYMPMGNEVQGQYTVTLPAGTIDCSSNAHPYINETAICKANINNIFFFIVFPCI